jgi:integrase/recombinase XerD
MAEDIFYAIKKSFYIWYRQLLKSNALNCLAMQTILLNPIYHRGQECLAVCFRRDAALNSITKKIPGAKWSYTHNCWYLPLDPASYQQVRHAFKETAALDISSLKTYLQKRKQVIATDANAGKNIHPKNLFTAPASKLSTENISALGKFLEQLKLKAYSPSTIRTYRNEFLQLLQLLKKKDVASLSPDDLKRYMVFAMEKERIKENTAHSRLNALKFYFEQVLKKEKFFWDIPRPKKPLQLPKLLNETEIRKLFNALTNKKHKAMLFTVYSAGLRLSELVHLTIADIDSRRMQIFIKRAKGKKDRYVNLSPVLLDILRSYIKNYKPRPKVYLFESEQTSTAYPPRTVQQIFNTAKHRAGIRKEVGIHSLRHSFATHLLDKGTDIKYIKDLLGHFDIRTTERYLHVSKKQLVNIISPFDDLMRTEKIDW